MQRATVSMLQCFPRKVLRSCSNCSAVKISVCFHTYWNSSNPHLCCLGHLTPFILCSRGRDVKAEVSGSVLRTTALKFSIYFIYHTWFHSDANYQKHSCQKGENANFRRTVTSPGIQFDPHVLNGSHRNDLNFNYGTLSAVCVIFFFWGSAT